MGFDLGFSCTLVHRDMFPMNQFLSYVADVLCVIFFLLKSLIGTEYI